MPSAVDRRRQGGHREGVTGLRWTGVTRKHFLQKSFPIPASGRLRETMSSSESLAAANPEKQWSAAQQVGKEQKKLK